MTTNKFGNHRFERITFLLPTPLGAAVAKCTYYSHPLGCVAIGLFPAEAAFAEQSSVEQGSSCQAAKLHVRPWRPEN